MNINTLQHVTKSLNDLSGLFNDLSSFYDLSVCLSELVKTDNTGFIDSVNSDLAFAYYNLFDCLVRLSTAVDVFSDKIDSLMSCFELLTNDKFAYVRTYEMGDQ